MAKEQVDRAVNDTSYKYGGIAKNPDLQAFWIERVAALLVYLCYWVPPDVEESFLIVAVILLVQSNSLYLISFISSDIFVGCESMAEELPSDVDWKKYAFWMERVAAILVLYSYYSANVNHPCRHFLLPAVLLHTISTSIYLATYVATHMDTQRVYIYTKYPIFRQRIQL
ncbi:hypothetical protein RHGRI_013375 [Rhododendron griersonianum]|uniref:Uncharacterized protein n=1 Tax=Rhododendron griersonianum TaxID=479676 RepID=A0AAV6K5A6_9ERIC|nr:hypothetical protein RHGRI_013375 [Rhododendron griersonianum]